MARVTLLTLISLLASCGGITTTPDPSTTDDTVLGDDDDIIGDDDDDDVVSATAPVAVDDSLAIDEGNQDMIDLVANDTDPTGDLATDTVALVDLPLNGDAVIQPGGMVGYRHDGSETTSDSFTYTVSDLNGELSNVATVTITVTPVNDAPTTFDDAFSVDEDGFANFDLILNDIDPDDGIAPATITVIDQPMDGSLVVNNDGTVDYSHDGSENALDNFTYTVDDISGLTSNVSNVDITINPINDIPIAVDDISSCYTGRSVVIQLSANDIDDDGFDLTSIALITNPLNGTIVINGDGSVEYTHSGDQTVVDSFSYTITDLAGVVSNVAQVDLTISVAPPCGGWDYNGGCWYSGNEGESCADTCAANCGFDPVNSQHAGNAVGFYFWPGKAFGGDWVAIECSSTDNNTNWGANNTVPDELYTFGTCHLNCACQC